MSTSHHQDTHTCCFPPPARFPPLFFLGWSPDGKDSEKKRILCVCVRCWCDANVMECRLRIFSFYLAISLVWPLDVDKEEDNYSFLSPCLTVTFQTYPRKPTVTHLNKRERSPTDFAVFLLNGIISWGTPFSSISVTCFQPFYHKFNKIYIQTIL